MVDFKKLLQEHKERTPEEREQKRTALWAGAEAEYKARDALLMDEVTRLSKDSRLNTWERDFIRDMERWLDRPEGAFFTDAQIAKIHALNTQYPEKVVLKGKDAIQKDIVALFQDQGDQDGQESERKVIFVEDDEVERYASEINEILALVGYHLDTCMITNESNLYDFSTCYPESEQPGEECEPKDLDRRTPQEYLQWHREQWDSWIKNKWADTFLDVPFGDDFRETTLVHMAERLRESRDRNARERAGCADNGLMQ